MSTALQISASDCRTLEPGRFGSGEYLDVHRRLGALSRIASRLPRLIERGRAARRGRRRAADLFRQRALRRSLRRRRRVAGVAALLSRARRRLADDPLRRHRRACPRSYRADFCLPRLIAGDGTRGPMMSAPVLEGVTLLGLFVVEAVPGAADFTENDHDALAGVAAQDLDGDSAAAQRQRSAARDRSRSSAISRRRGAFSAAFCRAGAVAQRLSRRHRISPGVRRRRRLLRSSSPPAPGSSWRVIGDVAGKGVAGALMMSRVLERDPPPGRLRPPSAERDPDAAQRLVLGARRRRQLHHGRLRQARPAVAPPDRRQRRPRAAAGAARVGRGVAARSRVRARRSACCRIRLQPTTCSRSTPATSCCS